MNRGQPVCGISLLFLALVLPVVEAAVTDPSRNAQLGQDGFVRECHDALEKGRLTQDKFSDFISHYCHDRPGPSCSDGMSFAVLPLELQQLFASGACSRDNQVDCWDGLMASGSSFDYRGNIDTLCASTYPLLHSTALIQDCKTSRYFKVNVASSKPLVSRLCTTPIDSVEPIETLRGVGSAAAVETKTTTKGSDKSLQDKGRDKKKGEITVPPPTLSPFSLVIRPTQRIRSSLEPSATTKVPTSPPSIMTTETTSPWPVAMSSVSPTWNESLGNATALNVTANSRQEETNRSTLLVHSLVGLGAASAGVMMVAAAVLVLAAQRRKDQSRLKRSAVREVALYGDASISSERSSTFKLEDLESVVPTNQSIGVLQSKRVIQHTVSSDRNPSKDSIWGDPKVFLRTLIGSRAKKSTSEQSGFSFPPPSPYLVEEAKLATVSPKSSLRRKRNGLERASKSGNCKDELQLLSSPMNHQSGRGARSFAVVPIGRRVRERSFTGRTGRQPTDISVQDCRPWRTKVDRPYSMLFGGSESELSIQSAERNLNRRGIPIDMEAVGQTTHGDLCDEESLASLSFLSPDIVQQFREVDQRLSDGFKEFNEVDERISQEFHKVESKLEQACEAIDLENSSVVSSEREVDTTEHHIIDCEAYSAIQSQQGGLYSDSNFAVSAVEMRPSWEHAHHSSTNAPTYDQEANDTDNDCVSVDSDKEVYEFSQLRSHFANVWYREPPVSKTEVDDRRTYVHRSLTPPPKLLVPLNADDSSAEKNGGLGTDARFNFRKVR
jgi:hypothetical protein